MTTAVPRSPSFGPALLSRRRALALLAATAVGGVFADRSSAERFVVDAPMKPGDYAWDPDRSPTGPVVIIVSLPEQLMHVYRNGIEIGRSTCSTGKQGHRTPTGVFTILEKEREHVSSIYKGAQMPNMERLTWGGIALHAGNLPGYPASHGCIRLPKRFSGLLYEVTHLGTVVIIADERTQPNSVVHPGLLMPSVADVEVQALATKVSAKPAPGGWQTTVDFPMTSILVSRADGMAYITRNGRQSGRHPMRIVDPKRPLGTHVYTLVGSAADGSGLLWLSFGVGKSHTEAHITNWEGDRALKRVFFNEPQHARSVAGDFRPGTTLTIMDAPAPQSTRATPKDFRVIVSDPGA
jgi:hypothetical protein